MSTSRVVMFVCIFSIPYRVALDFESDRHPLALPLRERVIAFVPSPTARDPPRIIDPPRALPALSHRGRASTFSTSERDDGNPDDSLACDPRRRLQRDQRAIAHWRLPCGARLLVRCPRTGREAMALVLDRGPMRARRHPALVDDLDLSEALARDLGANGWEPVEWERIEP